MIYGKLWLVVKPSVGIPLLLGAVAVSSFLVHLALMTHNTWLKQYYNGPVSVAMTEGAPGAAMAPPAAAPAQN